MTCHLQDITPPILKTPPRDPEKEGWAFDDATSKASFEIRGYENVDQPSNASSASEVSDMDGSCRTSISSKSRGHKRYYDDRTYLKRYSSYNYFAILKTPPRDPKTEGLAVQNAALEQGSSPRDHNDSSSGDSFDSDTDSRSSFTGSNSGTSISSKSRGHRRYFDHRSPRERRERRITYFLEPDARVPKGQEQYFESYDGTPRPYIPDVPLIDRSKHEMEEYSYVMKWLASEKSVCGLKVDKPVIVQNPRPILTSVFR